MAEFRMTAFVAYRKIAQIAIPLVAALLAMSAGRIRAQAQTTEKAPSNHMLVVPASDGYGFDDCMGSNKTCGQVIADAWCEAHGMSASVSFGPAEDVTASISAGVPAAKVEPGSFLVNCKE